MAIAVSNHFIWTDFPNFLKQLSDQYALTGSLRHRWAITDNPAEIYLTTLGWRGPGWPMLLLAAGGASALVSGLRMILSMPALPPVRWSGVGRVAAAMLVIAALSQPVWTGMVAFSRRVSRPTHDYAEAWIRENVAQGTIVLSGQGWLLLGELETTTRRVPNLKATLDRGIEQLGGCNLVIVPEPFFGHPVLRQLSLLRRFVADQSFGGNLGVDYEVYAVPALPTTGAVCSAGRPG